MDLRNRIVAHRTLPASSLKPHPSNPRTHPDEQRSVLRQLLAEIGLARSVLAYVADEDRATALAALGSDPPADAVHAALAAAPLTLIDGHLRQEELGDTAVAVEVLDVSDAEARTLLLSIDPLASLAGYDAGLVAALQERTPSAAVRELWSQVEAAAGRTKETVGFIHPTSPCCPNPRTGYREKNGNVWAIPLAGDQDKGWWECAHRGVFCVHREGAAQWDETNLTTTILMYL